MKQVNLRLLLLLVAIVGGGIVGVFLLHRFQVNRNAGSLAKLARLRQSEGKNDEALTLLARYVNFRPNDSQAYAELARLVLDRAESPMANRGDISRAYSVGETAVRRSPDDDELRQRLAAFEMRIGRFPDARQHLQILRSKLPDDPPAATDDPAPADNSAADTAKKPLDKTQIDILLARSWAGTGDFDEATALASALIGFDLAKKTFDPKLKAAAGSTEAFILLAAILEERFKDTASANAVIEQLVKVNASDPKAWLTLAGWHRQRGDLSAAKQDVSKAEQLAPDDPDTLLTSFEIAMSARDLAGAASIIERGLELAPLDERMVRGRAMLSMQQQEPAKAIELLEKTLATMPGRPTLLLMLADALMQGNRIREVEQTIGRLKEAVGNSSPAVGLLEARVMIAENRWLQAKSKLDTVRPLVAGSEELTRQVDLYLGQCYEQLGQFDQQLEANRRVLTDDPTSLAARAGAASALLASGKNDEALEEFERVAAAIPANRLAAIPQVWSPLLQLRVAAQTKRASADRNWSAIEDLLELLQQSQDISASQMALLRADVLVRRGETEAAGDLLNRAAEAEPKEAQVWAALATLALRNQGTAQARDVLKRAPKEILDSPNLLLAAAQIAVREPADAANEALADVERRAMTLPAAQAGVVLSVLASVHMGLNQPDEAERLWSTAIEKTPDDLRARTALYELAREQGNTDKARARAKELGAVAGETSPQARVAQAGTLILGVRESLKKKNSGAETALELNATERRELDEARNLLIEAENDRPGWYQIQQLFAEIDGLRGDMSAAIEHLQRAVRMGPANPGTVRQLVSLLYALNRLEEAQQALARLGPDGVEGFERISAEMEMREGKFDEAVALAERSVSKNSKNPRDLMWLGQLLSRSGQGDRAEGVLERAVEEAPDQPETWLTLFAHQLSAGKRKPAQRTLERAADLLPETSRELVLAQGNEMLGRFDEAEQHFREAAKANPDDLSAARNLAAFLVRRGRLNPAREELRGIIARQPAGDAAARGTQQWARRTLAQLMGEAGNYRELQEALELIQQNIGSDGKLPSDDVALQVSLLNRRPEPASWRRAIKLLEMLSASQPLSVGQRLQLALLREKAGRWEECRSELVSLVAGANSPPSLYALLVEQLIRHEELPSARIWLSKLQPMAPDAPMTLALEAKLALAENEKPTAVAAARKLMPAGPVPPEQVPQLKEVAKIMEDLGFSKAADKVLTEFAGRSVDGIVARAEFLGRQNRIDEALDLLETAWTRLPLERVLQSGLTIIRGKGDHPTAEMTSRLEQWFTKALREDQGSVVIALLRAELRDLQGRPDEVESLYRELLARKDLAPSGVAIVANNLAFHLARPETADEAAKLIDSAIAELGPHPDLLDTRGVVRIAAGDNRRAIEDLEEAVLEPSPVKFLHLALAQAEDKKNSAAKRSLERAKKLGLDPLQLAPADRQRLEKVEAVLGESRA